MKTMQRLLSRLLVHYVIYWRTEVKMLLILLCIIQIYSCSNKDLPGNVKVRNDMVYFLLKDKNYSSVSLGSNILGEWQNLPMKKVDSMWVISFTNPHKIVHYKFLINNLIWRRDPTNPDKVKIAPPYDGYNSIVEFE